MSHAHTHTHTPPCTIWILFHTCLRTSEPIFQVSFTNPAGAASFEICETHLIPHLIVRAYPPFLYSNSLTYSFPIPLYSMKPCKPLQIWEVVRCLRNKFKCIYKFKAILYRDTTAVQSSWQVQNSVMDSEDSKADVCWVSICASSHNSAPCCTGGVATTPDSGNGQDCSIRMHSVYYTPLPQPLVQIMGQDKISLDLKLPACNEVNLEESRATSWGKWCPDICAPRSSQAWCM